MITVQSHVPLGIARFAVASVLGCAVVVSACGSRSDTFRRDSKVMAAMPNDSTVTVVRVLDTSGPLARYVPMVITANSGFRVDTALGSCRIFKGFGFDNLDLANVPKIDNPDDPTVSRALPDAQPTLACHDDNAVQKLQVANVFRRAEMGKTHIYFQFRPRDRVIYDVGCKELATSFGFTDANLAAAPELTPGAMVFVTKIVDMNCRNGTPFASISTKTFTNWCLRSGLPPDQEKTVATLFKVGGKDPVADPRSELNCAAAENKLKADTTLDLAGKNLRSLAPLEGMTWVETLKLSGNFLTDLAPLSNLTNLVDLELQGSTQLTDLSALHNLEYLRTLNLSNTGISSFGVLEGMSYLETVNVQGSLIRANAPERSLFELCLMQDTLAQPAKDTMTALRGALGAVNCNQLLRRIATWNPSETLAIEGKNLTDVTPLAALRWTAVNRLSLARNAIQDVRPLAALGETPARLVALDLAGNPIAAANCPIASENRPLNRFCSRMGKSFVYWCELRNSDPEWSMAVQETLNQLYGLLSTLPTSCDERFDRLQTRLRGARLAPDLGSEFRDFDLRPLKGLTQLHALTVCGQAIPDASVLGTLSQLEELDLDCKVCNTEAPPFGCQLLPHDLSDYGFLTQLTNLKTLRITALEWSDGRLAALESLPSLRSLDLEGNAYGTGMHFLGAFTALQDLRIGGFGAIASLSPFAQYPTLAASLKALRVNTVSDTLVPLAALRALSSLSIHRRPTGFADLSPLAGMANLGTFDANVVPGLHGGSPQCPTAAQSPGLKAFCQGL